MKVFLDEHYYLNTSAFSRAIFLTLSLKYIFFVLHTLTFIDDYTLDIDDIKDF